MAGADRAPRPDYLARVPAADCAAPATAFAARPGPLNRPRPPDDCCAAAAMLSTTLAISLRTSTNSSAGVDCMRTCCRCTTASRVPLAANQPLCMSTYAAALQSARQGALQSVPSA